MISLSGAVAVAVACGGYTECGKNATILQRLYNRSKRETSNLQWAPTGKRCHAWAERPRGVEVEVGGTWLHRSASRLPDSAQAKICPSGLQTTPFPLPWRLRLRVPENTRGEPCSALSTMRLIPALRTSCFVYLCGCTHCVGRMRGHERIQEESKAWGKR